ncbi:VOC family protein [Empedobacter brevis]
MNRIVYFEIQANDIQKCIDFYSNVFGIFEADPNAQ